MLSEGNSISGAAVVVGSGVCKLSVILMWSVGCGFSWVGCSSYHDLFLTHRLSVAPAKTTSVDQ